MAKIVTWADLSTSYVTRGTPTNRCPTHSMIVQATKPNYTYVGTAAGNQLEISTSFNQSGHTYMVKVVGNGVINPSPYEIIVNIGDSWFNWPAGGEGPFLLTVYTKSLATHPTVYMSIDGDRTGIGSGESLNMYFSTNLDPNSNIWWQDYGNNYNLGFHNDKGDETIVINFNQIDYSGK